MELIKNVLSLFTVLFVFIFNSGAFGHICDICDCQPSRYNIFSITCDGDSNKSLRITSNLMIGAESATMMIIKNCNMVNIGQNSFSRLEKLDTLAIQNSLFVSLASAAFSSLNSLLINNVQDISLREMALMGARGIKNIIINSSNITQLSTYSLYDIQGMERLTLGNVTIGQINQDAIKISSKTITLQNIKINHIDNNGVHLSSEKTLIKNSIIKNPNIGSININSQYQTRFLKNDFGNIFQINITSPFVEFTGNRFENFHSSVFKDIQMSRLMNNTFTGINSYAIFKVFRHQDFYDNYFKCACGMKLLEPNSKYESYEILKRNYCLANCNLTLFEFEIESLPRCMRDGEVDPGRFCSLERAFKNGKRARNLDEDLTKDVPNTFSANTIAPRFLTDLENSTTSKGFSTQTGSGLFMLVLIAVLG